MEEVRRIESLKVEYDIKAVTASPAMISPPVPVNDKKWYPIYAKLVELDIPFVLVWEFQVLVFHSYLKK